MPVVATPIFVQAVKCDVVQVTTANTNRDGSTGDYSAAVTFDADGAILEAIKVTAIGTTTAGVIRAYYAADGTTYRLLWEMLVSAITPSSTVAVWGATAPSEGLWIPPHGLPMNVTGSSTIRFSTHVSETFNIFVIHGGY